MRRIASLIAGITGIALTVGASAADIDWGKVDQALGKPGTSQPGGVHKYGLPRTDLKITLDGVAIKPTLALGSWIGFLPTGDGAMFMGDLVLTENEISPVMKRLIEDGAPRRRSFTCMSPVTGTPSNSRRRCMRDWP
jgi:hypothetical protein